jgi:hypothetical protein
MLRTSALFILFVITLGAGIAVAAWPHGGATASDGVASEQQLLRAYARVRDGMPASRLEVAGFDTARVQRLSALALMERFMPKDSFAFDSQDPAVQRCFEGSDGCAAYIFHVAEGPAQALLLVEGGRVAWKTLSGVDMAAARSKRRMARN